MSERSRPNIFAYSNYRNFLKETYLFLKETRDGFSFRSFSKDAGLLSSNFLKLVIDGKRNLTDESIEKFIKALKLQKHEANFFSSLVQFNQAKTSDLKNRYYERMMKSRSYREVQLLDAAQYEYLSNWYHVPIRELVGLRGFREDPKWIASQLEVPISPAQAADAIELLLKLRLLERGADGKLRQSQTSVSTGPEVASLAALNFHKSILDQTSKALDCVPAHERDVSALTVSLRADQIAEAKEKIAKFRREFLEWADSQSELGDRVYQFNLYLVPITKKLGDS